MKQLYLLRLALFGLTGTAVLLITLITAGLFDPKPVGQRMRTWPATAQTAPAQGQYITWLPEPLLPGSFTVRTAVAHQSGELDSSAGVALADDCTVVIIAVSPLGYVTVHQTPPLTDYCLPITAVPWQPWPHIRPNDELNELWVDVEDGQLRVRLNRELLWVGDAFFQPALVGLYSESFGETAVFHFQQIELFAQAKPPEK